MGKLVTLKAPLKQNYRVNDATFQKGTTEVPQEAADALGLSYEGKRKAPAVKTSRKSVKAQTGTGKPAK